MDAEPDSNRPPSDGDPPATPPPNQGAEGAAADAAPSGSEGQDLARARASLTPESRVPTREQQLRFLERIAAGERHDIAARQCGSTGSRFRALRKRDASFHEAMLDAEKEAPSGYADRIRKEITERAFDRNDMASARLLTQEAEAWLPEYEHRRTRHTKLSGGLSVKAIPFIDAAALEQLSDTEFATFMELFDRIRADKEPLEVQPGPETPLRLVEGGGVD